MDEEIMEMCPHKMARLLEELIKLIKKTEKEYTEFMKEYVFDLNDELKVVKMKKDEWTENFSSLYEMTDCLYGRLQLIEFKLNCAHKKYLEAYS